MAERRRGGRGELERSRVEIVVVLGRGGEAAGVAKTGKSRRVIPLGIERYKEEGFRERDEGFEAHYSSRGSRYREIKQAHYGL